MRSSVRATRESGPMCCALPRCLPGPIRLWAGTQAPAVAERWSNSTLLGRSRRPGERSPTCPLLLLRTGAHPGWWPSSRRPSRLRGGRLRGPRPLGPGPPTCSSLPEGPRPRPKLSASELVAADPWFVGGGHVTADALAGPRRSGRPRRAPARARVRPDRDDPGGWLHFPALRLMTPGPPRSLHVLAMPWAAGRAARRDLLRPTARKEAGRG